VRVLIEDHPMIRGIDFATLPPLLGFNETRRRDDCETIVEIRFADRWCPLLATRSLGAGRVSSWTTGASPHWGINLVKWPQYDLFWNQMLAAKCIAEE